jgi:hypothetical protein
MAFLFPGKGRSLLGSCVRQVKGARTMKNKWLIALSCRRHPHLHRQRVCLERASETNHGADGLYAEANYVDFLTGNFIFRTERWFPR